MRKTHMKLGSLIVMTCLFLAAGMFVGGGHAAAHHVQTAKKFHHWFAQAPHITVKMLPGTSQAHVSRVAISGVGFANCCTPAPSACSSGCDAGANTSAPCTIDTCNSSTTSGSSTNTNTTTTTTTTTTISPSVTTYTPAPSTVTDNTCPSSCSNNAPAAPSNYGAPAAPSDTCPSYNTCGNSAPAAPSTCPSYDPCGNTTPSTTDCTCNTVDLQSSAPISAPGINLTRVPVNAFGEFRVIVNLQPTRIITRHNVVPTIWAINSYNDQPSNYASTCCSYSSCCQ